MANKIIKIGIVGCGNIINRHIHAIKSNKNLQLIAVCDKIKDRADTFAIKSNSKAYYDYPEMLKRKDIDLISVCTPSHIHADMTIKAAQLKKHVITEKPIALDLKDAKKMIGECKKNKVKLFVVNQRRFNPAIQELEKAFNNNRFGKIILANVTIRWSRPQSYYDEEEWRRDFKKGGGVLLNQSVHFIDFLQRFCGEPKSVMAKTKIQNHNTSGEDTALAILTFKNGALGVIEATTCVFRKNLEGSITLIGDKGTAKISGTGADKIEIWDFKDFKNKDRQILKRHNIDNVQENFAHNHTQFYRQVYSAITRGDSKSIDGEEALKSLKIILACYKSAKMNRTITLR